MFSYKYVYKNLNRNKNKTNDIKYITNRPLYCLLDIWSGYNYFDIFLTIVITADHINNRFEMEIEGERHKNYPPQVF